MNHHVGPLIEVLFSALEVPWAIGLAGYFKVVALRIALNLPGLLEFLAHSVVFRFVTGAFLLQRTPTLGCLNAGHFSLLQEMWTLLLDVLELS